MMKLAWLCYSSQFNDDTGYYKEEFETISFTEPGSYYYTKVVPIVYTEVEQ